MKIVKDKCTYCDRNFPLLFYDEDGVIFCLKCKNIYQEEMKKLNNHVTVIGCYNGSKTKLEKGKI